VFGVAGVASPSLESLENIFAWKLNQLETVD
jgi:hypothetical protein